MVRPAGDGREELSGILRTESGSFFFFLLPLGDRIHAPAKTRLSLHHDSCYHADSAGAFMCRCTTVLSICMPDPLFFLETLPEGYDVVLFLHQSLTVHSL